MTSSVRIMALIAVVAILAVEASRRDLPPVAVVVLAAVLVVWLVFARLQERGSRGLPRSSAARTARHFGGSTASRSAPYLATTAHPSRLGLAELAERLGMDVNELRSFRPRYRTFTISKRSGGERVLAAPDAGTKALQRRILRRVLARLRVHDACHGFERNRSIVSNALVHARPAVLLRLDIQDFFGSTSARRVRRLYRVLGWDRAAAAVLVRLTTHEGGLPQGAPTSPRLANLVNHRLDARLAGLAVSRGARFTRYADDLTFSFDTDDRASVSDVIRATRRFVGHEGYRLHLGSKLRIRRPHQRQLVTGLVVNVRPGLPRAQRRRLRAVEHHIRTGRPATLTDAQLMGWRAFELMVEAPVTGQQTEGR